MHMSGESIAVIPATAPVGWPGRPCSGTGPGTIGDVAIGVIGVFIGNQMPKPSISLGAVPAFAV